MKFNFKQFSISQEKSAMKVGTDGVLLGAWTPIDHDPYNILDIGAGTGLIALMLAQRSEAAQIDAIEVEEAAYEECVKNFEQSPWNDRLFCYHADLEEFTDEFFEEETYDLIVSNPPFFSENYFSDDATRNLARFEESLPHYTLLTCAEALLSESGVLALIIPYKEEEKWITYAQEIDLFPFKITRVKGTEQSEIKRSLLAFSRENIDPIIEELIIEESRHQYTELYKNLTKEFYVKM
ncbi:tRNA1(Val) (adenine(37)-N6)-methyltransferase [Capnocytophaga sp. ARDL2]|uniref:tRNA1(Val) (adenine(37)-N6)-methyltransferase n=1 Tax=Capnocytophaga sp. ARDL2 TaxID=3238809 RepID=UPI003557436D